METSRETRSLSHLGDSAATTEPDCVENRNFGSRLGRYVVLEELGHGSMGVVYAAYDPQLSRRVALKVIRAEGSVSPAGRARRQQHLLREARVLAAVAHPHVITIHDVGALDQDVFIAMEFVDGMTLRDWLAPRRSTEDILDLFEQAGRGLAAAHAEGIVHRDFKPDNVLVGKDGRVRVTDFGVARLAGPPSLSSDIAESPPEQTGSSVKTITVGALIGTPAYMAPEQLSCRGVGPASDQFAFCVCLYEALVGERPFFGPSPEVLLEHIEKGIPTVLNALPAELDALIRRGLEPAAHDRFPSMEALIDALEGIRRRPPQRRRLVVLGAVGGLSFAGLALYGQSDDPCDALDPPTGWSEQTRDSVSAAFERSQLEFSAHLAPAVLEGLDGFVASWRAAKADVCRARVDANVAATAVSGVDSCLQAQWIDFESTAVFLVGAGDAELHHALDLVDELPDPSACLPDHAAPTVPDTDVDPDGRDAVLAVLARAKTAQGAAQLEDARRLAKDAVRRAEVLGHDELLARALLLYGSVSASQAMLDDAERLLHRGLLAAERSANGDLGVQLLSAQAFTAARRRDRARAEERLALARARLDGLGSANDRMRISLEVRAGDIARMTGDPDQAIRTWEAVMEDLGDDRWSRRQHAIVLHRLGAAYYRKGDTDRGLALWEQARADWSVVAGPNHPRIAELDTNLALGAYHDGRCTEARDRVKAALELLEGTMGKEVPNLIPGVSILANAHACLGEHEESLALRHRALSLMTLRHGPEHPRTVTESLRLAEAYAMASHFEDARKHLAISESQVAELDDHPFITALFDHVSDAVERERPPARPLEERDYR